MTSHAAFQDHLRTRSSWFAAASRSPLVGREQEVALALSLLQRDDVRLLTLTGPGGIGKTRLGIEVAHRLNDVHQAGSHIVSLADIPKAGMVAAAIARALGLGGGGQEDALEALIDGLRETEALLLLDNFEHVLQSAHVVADMLASCPLLKVVATSQSPLRISWEHALPVPPLSLPGRGPGRPLEEIASSPSVRLFVERARAVDPSFDLDGATAPVIAAVCHRLAGIPLAIELAATQVSVLSPPALLARIEAGLPLPLAGPSDAPDRLKTMERAIAWSYDLLSPDEQRLIRCLGVFTGSFGPEAAGAVCGHVLPQEPAGTTDGERDPDIVPLLASLVSKSLLRVGKAGELRYTMLETIRQFVLHRLDAEGEADKACDAHAGWYLRLAERTQHAAITPGGEEALTQLEADNANFLGALEWLAARGESERLVRLVLSLSGFWYEHSHYREARAWLERALPLAQGSMRARVLVHLGLILSFQGDTARAGQLLDEGIAVLRQEGDPLTVALVLVWRGAVANFRGHYERAEQLLEEALGLASDFADPPIAAAMTARALANLGIAARARGDLELAAVRHELALRICREHGYKFGAIRSLVDLGDVVRDQGDYVRSLEFYRECLFLAGEEMEQRVVVGVLEGAALAAVAWNDPNRAVQMLGAADALSSRLGMWILAAVDQDVHERVMDVAHAMLGERAYQAAWSTGRQWTLSRAIAEVHGMSPPADVVGPPPGEYGITLSPREEEILRLLVSGRSDREMSEALYLSVRTVEAHVARLRAKLGVRTRTAAVTTAIAIGLVDPGDSRPGQGN